MKKIFQYIGCALLAGLALTACSPDSFDGADETKIPTVAGLDFTMEVDQEVNQVTVNYPTTAGTYPIWIFNGATYSTLNNAGWSNTEAGTYTVELKLGNRNGISHGSIKKTFTFNETKVNYTTMLNRISGKEWRIDSAEPAHLACGPYGGDGSGWWNATPDEKKDFGVYDDRISFTVETNTGGTFTYNPGADGLTYVNKDCSLWNNGGADADFDMATQEQTASYEFKRGQWTDAEGNVQDADYLVLAPNTLFPYISADAQYQNPRFRIETLTASKMVLVYENAEGGISWRFIFTSKEAEKTFEGFDANSEFNMWKGITPEMEFYYADASWTPYPTPPGFTDAGNDYTIELPEATVDQWQAQVKFHTDLTTSAANHYDFSAILNSDKDLNGATVKLVHDGGGDYDNIFYFADRIDLKAGEDYVFWKSDMEGIDMSKVMLVLDFGGCQAGTTVNVRNIVLKDHANDDGTVLPGDTSNGDIPVFDWNPDATVNLWKAVEDGSAFISVTPWFADNNWSQIANPEWSHDNGVWELTIPEGMGNSQWQGQFPINTTLQAMFGKKYNFYVIVEADNDCNGVTIKLTESDESDGTKHDDNFFFADQHNIQAGEPYIYKAQGVTLAKDDAHALSLFFDFGGSPIGTHIKISKIYFEEAVSVDYDDANNLWKAVDNGEAFVSVTPWFADNNWSTISNPEWSHSGKTWELTLPDGIGSSQWQGQFPINTTITAQQSNTYSFSCTLMADNDCNGVTIKLTQSDESDGTKHDDNFFFADQHNIQADEPYVYTVRGVSLPIGDAHALSLFFDFGGSPADAHIEISDIVLIKE